MANIDIQKDESVKEVLVKLFERFGQSNFYLTDYWDGDLCAIGIKKSKNGEFPIYISTWKMSKNHYFVEVEDSKMEVVLNAYKNGEL